MNDSIIRMVEADLERPNYGPEPAADVVAGEPIETTHEYFDHDGVTRPISCGTQWLWALTAPCWMIGEQTEAEFVTMLAGKLGLIDEAGNEEIFVAGDSFFLPKGITLTWVVYETIHKFYMTAETGS